MTTRQIQHLESLKFFLFTRSIHPELFEIQDDIRIAKDAYEAQIWITGCSHVISFYRGDAVLTEVVADRNTPLPTHGRCLEILFRGEKKHERKQFSGIDYMMNLQVEVMSPRVYHATHHDLAKQGAKHGRFVPFPKWQSRSLTPFSYVNYDVKPEQLHIMAFHAFPKELTIIKTQSIFELG